VDLRSTELRDVEVRGKTGNGKGAHAKVAKGAKFREGEQAKDLNAEGAVGAPRSANRRT
jgi:hypothetical protein